MWKDEIVEETRRERDAYTAKFDRDIEAIFRDLKAKEEQGNRKVVSLSPKQPMRFVMLEEKSSIQG